MGKPERKKTVGPVYRKYFRPMIDRYLPLDGALGAELQQSLSPADAVALLKDGVRRSTSGDASARAFAALRGHVRVR